MRIAIRSLVGETVFAHFGYNYPQACYNQFMIINLKSVSDGL
jgi:hypothetical protein